MPGQTLLTIISLYSYYDKNPMYVCILSFQLVELNGAPRMKLSQDITKVTVPGKKNIYRLYGNDGKPHAGCLFSVISMCKV